MESVNKDIPKGYKESPLGIIPEDWSVVRLKDKFDRITTKNEKGVTNVLTISAQHGLINQEEYFNKSVASKNLSTYTLLSKGDFAYNKSYSNGYPYGAIKKLNKYDEGVVSSLYICFRPSNNNKSPDFYEQYFEAGMLNREIHAIAQEGARNHGLLNISIVDFFNSYIIDGDERELNKIADILNTWDKAIELKEKLIDQKKEQKKGLMQKLLTGEVRLPGFNGEWIEVKLGDLGECIRGVSYNPKDLYLNDNQNSIRLLRSNNIQDGTLNNDDIQYVDKSIVKEKQLLRKNDLVISMANGSKKLVGKNGVFHSLSNFEYTVGAFCAIFRFNNKCSPNYAKYLFQTNKYEYFVQNLIAGSNINNLKPSDIESMKFIVPANRNEQEEIAKVIDQITNEIKLLGKEILLLKQQKKGLMQLLLTGKVRVKV
jgi:type I restriction enzyme, S subunit